MDKFVIERFVDGQMIPVEIVEVGQRLLNEHDLSLMIKGDYSPLSFVYLSHNLANGYYMDIDGRWTYGDYETAKNIIKKRYE